MFRNRPWPAILCDRGFESLMDHAPYVGVVSAQVEYAMPSEEIEVLFTVNVLQIAALALGVDDVMADHLQYAGQGRIDILAVQRVVFALPRFDYLGDVHGLETTLHSSVSDSPKLNCRVCPGASHNLSALYQAARARV